jgi:hypothetical protein
MKDLAHNNYNNLMEIHKDVIKDSELSLTAIGLYIILLSGDIFLHLDDEEYREAFKELYDKNYIEITIK